MSQLPQESNGWTRFSQFVSESASIKLIAIGFIILLLLIPLSLVNDLMHERNGRHHEAITEVSQTWGGEQTITGLFIAIPYFEKAPVTSGNAVVQPVKSTATFLPEDLRIDGRMEMEERTRGIYQVPVYTTKVTIEGSFLKPDFRELNEAQQVLWEEAHIQLGLSDLRGLEDLMVLTWNDTTIHLSPGVSQTNLIQQGVSAPVSLSETSGSKPIHFRIQFSFRGSQGIYFMPLGRETTVHLTGNWQHPSFQGAFLPSHSVENDEFTADWKVLYLNRNYPQAFTGYPQSFDESRFGMSVYIPISDYQKNQRAAKYAVLIIALTFMVFFFVQILNKVRIHGIQFILVGLALCLFYVLLLSFTEHMGFNWAYLLSTAMTVGLVSLYVSAIFKKGRLSLLNFLFMLLVYLFVFVIIQLEHYALLVGSIGLFLVLAVAMYLSRNITWNDQLSNKS
jgi:inner membrane protein